MPLDHIEPQSYLDQLVGLLFNGPLLKFLHRLSRGCPCSLFSKSQSGVLNSVRSTMAFTDLLSSVTLAHGLILLGFLGAYVVQLAVRRLYFSPISHIPGPKLAAATWWYEFYYDIVLGGQYTFKIIDLHKKYGPVVRINPDEVHVGDPDFYPELYPGASRRREKTRFFVKQVSHGLIRRLYTANITCSLAPMVLPIPFPEVEDSY